MKIIEIEPTDNYRIQQFIDLQARIYHDTPQWVPPFASDLKVTFDQERNPYYRHSQAAFFLALAADGTAIGRLAVLNNRHYNDFNHEATAFFWLFECINDLQAASGLFEAACAWARRQGMTRLVGPRGFSPLDGLGMLVEGFEHRPALGVAYNPAYYPLLLEAAGLSTHSDILSGYISSKIAFPERIHRISELVQRRRGLSVARYKSRKDLRQLASQLKDLYNGMIVGTEGNFPLTDDEVRTIADQLLRFADPRLVKVVMKGDTPVGYLFAYPDISAALQRTQGKIFPFGWIDLLGELRHTEWVNINGMGILGEYQGLGGTAILFSEMHKSILEGGFKHAELVQIGADNDKMHRELRELGIDFYKTHRLYQKDL